MQLVITLAGHNHSFRFHFMPYNVITVWGVDPDVTHQTYDASCTCRLGAQVSVVCHKPKLVSVLLKEEPAVPLLVT